MRILIIGHGLCGAWLAYELYKAGIDFLVIDENKPVTASKIASGIINPVTGRRHVKSWMIDEVMPFAVERYRSVETSLIGQHNILDFYPTAQMRDSFISRAHESGSYLRESSADWSRYFNYQFGIGEINPCWLVDVVGFLELRIKQLREAGLIIEERFYDNELQIRDDVVFYRDQNFTHVVFCDGVRSANSNRFSFLPFAPNKGEVLLIECPGLPVNHIYKCGKVILPWRHDLFWVGSSFEWQFDNDEPSENFRIETVEWLNRFVKIPYKIMDQLSALRPANQERRPFVGFLKSQQQVGILNGMGTKGVSLAPWFAHELVQHLLNGLPINSEAVINRFEF